ncbi:MAG TPA: acyl carrier protein [Thermodesulfobacteriota bacterium]|nr:acyl carrier protein [Thermodesulfobacteriota bacterium]
MSQEIKNRVKKVLINKFLQDLRPEYIKDDTPLIELGVGVDSVATLELIVALEEEFEIGIDESEINRELLTNLTSISDYISERIRTGSR